MIQYPNSFHPVTISQIWPAVYILLTISLGFDRFVPKGSLHIDTVKMQSNSRLTNIDLTMFSISWSGELRLGPYKKNSLFLSLVLLTQQTNLCQQYNLYGITVMWNITIFFQGFVKKNNHPLIFSKVGISSPYGLDKILSSWSFFNLPLRDKMVSIAGKKKSIIVSAEEAPGLEGAGAELQVEPPPGALPPSLPQHTPTRIPVFKRQDDALLQAELRRLLHVRASYIADVSMSFSLNWTSSRDTIHTRLKAQIRQKGWYRFFFSPYFFFLRGGGNDIDRNSWL